ncbi:prepilin type IV pili (plasmid) [Burkholderia cenocepacia]|uniref:prepilin type IV pili n=1 Tax=Burkholderia cepacia complex TaxID=87882 RepID=UPI001CF13D22|nr:MULTISPECIES: prepilin type IV pili [Burkholderia cepacia complex]MCA8355596.1 prepilin type IV pili [Burkholderia cepacia]MCO8402824.1 prepilin type IV pili [Burkholderia cenocepacia]MCO8415063.1 prepilin type IV pili [Burkholderia cenocepacia]MCO8423041.1 prepilin type IV pili [Burkholderia cenocepacia]MCO8474810.1 prepilin type IV pili [Burkholderia cenocepacia]
MDGPLGRLFAFVLGLLALIGVTVAGYYGFQAYRANSVVEGMTMLQTNITTLYTQANTGYATLTTGNIPTLITQQVFPPNWVRGQAAVDPWGNNVTLTSANNSTQGVIQIGGGGSENVNTCSKVVMGLSNYVQLAVGGTTFTQAAPPDPIAAGKACANTPTIAMTFQ